MCPRSLVPSSVPCLCPTPSAGRRRRGKVPLTPWAERENLSNSQPLQRPFFSLTLMDPWKGGVSNGQRPLCPLGRDPRHSGFGLLGVDAQNAPSQ